MPGTNVCMLCCKATEHWSCIPWLGCCDVCCLQSAMLPTALAQLASTASPPVRAAVMATCLSPAPPIWQQCGTWHRAAGSCSWAVPAHALTSTGVCLGRSGRQSASPAACVRACLCLVRLSGSLCVCRAAAHVASGAATDAVSDVVI
jgi:hypothetical protein